MRKKTISFGIALVVATVFLLLVLLPGGSEFNLLPYAIHESISPGGAGETTFIRMFDIICGILIFLIIYWLLSRLIKNKVNR
jgi:small-conductance mechanosensitive channel